MTEAFHSIFILADPGPFREGLAAVIASLPHGSRIYLEGLPEAALPRVASLQPTVIMLDADLGKGRLELLTAELRRAAPTSRILALVGTVADQEMALRAGASAALLKGTPIDRLITTIEGLMAGLTSV